MNRKIILSSRPNGVPIAENFQLIEEQPPRLNKGEVLCKTIYLSLDPYMRGRMNDSKSYAKPISIGDVMEAGAVSQVLESQSDDFTAGDFVEGRTGWQDMASIDAKNLRKLDPQVAPISTAIGILGMPGTTAFTGMQNIAKPKLGETLVVAAASGAVGSAVGQIGKIHGCNVIGIAGSQQKCSYVTGTLGFDSCIDYHHINFEEKIKAACPNGIDIYWENVGGKIFDAVLPLLNDFARIPVCGLISMYNQTSFLTEPNKLAPLFRSILTKRLSIRGFIVFDFEKQKVEAIEKMTAWVNNGKIKYKEDFIDGLENSPKAFIGLLDGKNFGKQIIRVSEDPTLG